MGFKALFAGCAAMLLASGAVAQRSEYLPTSKDRVKPSAVTAPAPASITAPALEPENTLNLDLSTGGRVVVQLRPDIAPRHVERIKTLVRKGFYDGIIFHRVIEGFMAQTGDPSGTGMGSSDLPDVTAEFTQYPHVRGVISAARAGDPNSANSQFFIMLAPRFSLDGQYSAFGRVVSGMQYVDQIERGEPPASPARIIQASIGADNVPPPSQAKIAAAMARPLAAPPAPAAPAPAAGTPAPAAPAAPAQAPEQAPEQAGTSPQ
jgi:peptidylprolyl isomerase